MRPIGLIRHLIGLRGRFGSKRIENGYGAAQIATGECIFHSTGMRDLLRRTSRDPCCRFHLRLRFVRDRDCGRAVAWSPRTRSCWREFLLCARNESVGLLISSHVRNGKRKAGYMRLAKTTLSFLAVAAAMLLVAAPNFGRPVRARTLVQNSTTEASDTSPAKIARA